MMKIKNVKYSYEDVRYNVGPLIDFYAELEVNSCAYTDVIKAILKQNPKIANVRVFSFKR